MIVKKISKIVIKSVALAVASRVGVAVLRKLNKDGSLEAKANEIIDSQTERARTAAKSGVAKTISASEGSVDGKDI